MTNETTELPPSLATFFEHAGRFLVSGEGSAEDVERVLGSSPSGTARLALYATLVERQQLEALDTLFPATRRALDALEPGAFRALTRRFVASHRSPIAHPGGLGVAFPRFVETDAPTPWAHELVDSERVRYELATSPVPLPEHGFDPVFALRRYTHAVHAVDAERPLPELRAVSLLFARDPRTLRVRWLELGTPELVAIGVATGEHDAGVAASLGLSDEATDRARTRLRDVGWLRA
ncbi:MAG: putative DNA-binding domain-containing protein [Sandaracinus sp.]|nr:putative DNA-binding domain-containing protein [Sandaracinus sp.]MCB9613200.1 putative DNA-binding domain-containing protein [Sandaracinus sp.]